MVQAPDPKDVDPEVRGLVIDILGHDTSDEVLGPIDYLWNRDVSNGHKIIIGKELLINLVVPRPVPDGSGIGRYVGTIVDLIRKGQQERTSKGYRMFRLLLVTDKPDMDQLEPLAKMALVDYEMDQGADDGVAVHVLDRKDLPELIRKMVS